MPWYEGEVELLAGVYWTECCPLLFEVEVAAGGVGLAFEVVGDGTLPVQTVTMAPSIAWSVLMKSVCS